MKILLIGGEGQLGSDVFDLFREKGFLIVSPSHGDLDITNYHQVSNWFQCIKPDVVINTAAFHDVIMCERDPQKAFAVNSFAIRNLAMEAKFFNSLLIHISTDYVFSGKSTVAYKEDDITEPLSVYGNSKLSGELFIRSILKKYYIIRTSGLYGSHICRGKGKPNFVNLMLKLAEEKGEVHIVDDEILTPTYTVDVANQILNMLRWAAPSGIYHCTNAGWCSWYVFAEKIFDIAKKKVKMHRMNSEDNLRPKYSVLKIEKLEKLKIDIMPCWTESLRKYITSL
jgi:dTDP-4-dehydrorhamnose reductase